MKTSSHRSNSTSKKHPERGIALVTTLLLLIMLSALSVAFVLAVNTENRLQGGDKGSTQAYYGTEAGMEQAMIDLNGLYASLASPNVSQIGNLSANGCTSNCPFPDIPGIQYTEYNFTATPDPNSPSTPKMWPSTVSAGPNQGLIADIIPISLAVTSHTAQTEEVRMLRNVEVALIPVFQFGVFSDSDLDFFAGPLMTIGGRVQTNGDLYLAAGNGTTFLGKLRSAKEVVRDKLANNWSVSTGYGGAILIPKATGGCNAAPPDPSTCAALAAGDGSWLNGTWPQPTLSSGSTTGSGNNNWGTITGQTGYNGFLLSIENGVKPLRLPFVQTGVSSIEILRRPDGWDTQGTSLSRLYNKAQIRVLLDDDSANLPGGRNDANNIRLANGNFGAMGVPDYTLGVPVNPTAACTTFPACNSYFAEGTTQQFILKQPVPKPPAAPTFLPDPGWAAAGLPKTDKGLSAHGGTGVYPGGAPVKTPSPTDWNLLDGWIRVEVRMADGSYKAVTKEWLELGFARGYQAPTAPGTNPVHPKAILVLQQLANRYSLVDQSGNSPASIPAGPNPGLELIPSPTTTLTYAGAGTVHNFYPINIYDTREGETRELQGGSGSFGCSVNGVLNLTEIDVGNLQQWLLNSATGKTVENQSQNGYVLYFSDHRGMIPQPTSSNPPPKTPPAGMPPFAMLGSYGFEDVINPSSNTGTPNQQLDGGEEVEIPGDPGSSTTPQVYGSYNVGLGFGFTQGSLAPAAFGGTFADEVFTRMSTCNVGRANWVSGARHGVRLIDGGPGNLPLRPNGTITAAGTANDNGGFTVASDNPLYVQGNYNASAAGYLATDNYSHASAAVIADTVTLLSNNWDDLRSFASPGQIGAHNVTLPGPTTVAISGRPATTTYYRLAIASGKNVDFTQPAYTGGVTPIGQVVGTAPNDVDRFGKTAGPPRDFGTDGGVHNFLRYLENWGGQTSFYNGSMVSLYYSQYATGVFKCCGTVYSPPTRNYNFDLDFTKIDLVPPGTPRFQEIINVGYKQDLSYR